MDSHERRADAISRNAKLILLSLLETSSDPERWRIVRVGLPAWGWYAVAAVGQQPDISQPRNQPTIILRPTGGSLLRLRRRLRSAAAWPEQDFRARQVGAPDRSPLILLGRWSG
jgi:hypothetical protein